MTWPGATLEIGRAAWGESVVEVGGCAAGAGKLDIPGLLQAVYCSPHPFNAILETWVTPSDSLDETLARERRWAGEGVDHLRTLIPDGRHDV